MPWRPDRASKRAKVTQGFVRSLAGEGGTQTRGFARLLAVAHDHEDEKRDADDESDNLGGVDRRRAGADGIEHGVGGDRLVKPEPVSGQKRPGR
jgi:hypothetical protein